MGSGNRPGGPWRHLGIQPSALRLCLGGGNDVGQAEQLQQLLHLRVHHLRGRICGASLRSPTALYRCAAEPVAHTTTLKLCLRHEEAEASVLLQYNNFVFHKTYNA